jgi:hypothetical protein
MNAGGLPFDAGAEDNDDAHRTASSLPSYMEGAARAGERAADEVLSAG